MKAGEIQQSLARWNPWWKTEAWQRDDPELRAAANASFRYRAGCLADLRVGGLYVLRGPRRAGMSTEIKHAIADLLNSGVTPRRIIHAAVDGWTDRDLRTLVTSAARTFLAGVDQPRFWFIDEITSIDGDWPSTVKNLRDTDRRFHDDTVVLTGSSATRLEDARKALAGRRGPISDSDRMLLPMRFTDFARAAGVGLPPLPTVQANDLRSEATRSVVTDLLLPYLDDLIPTWEAYLRVGGFPQAVSSWLASGDVDREFLGAMWNIAHGDAIRAERFSGEQTLTLLDGLTRNLGSPLIVSDLARDLDVDRKTAQSRLADLTRSFLIWPCHQEQGLAPKLSARSKWYFTDPVLARLAASRGRGQEPDHTRMSEQQVGLCLLRSLASSGAGAIHEYGSVMHYHSATRAEIDFVGRGLGRSAVESKYTDDRWGRELQTIAASPWFGIIASRSGVEWRDDAWIIPAAMLALLLGA